jgi:hypothetical protein
MSTEAIPTTSAKRKHSRVLLAWDVALLVALLLIVIAL